MRSAHRFLRAQPRAVALALLAALLQAALAACGTAGARPAHQLTLGLTYIPNIQFAPFYIADALGYYKDAGLNVTLRHHGFNESEFAAIAGGQENAIFAGGDEVMQARAQGQPLVYVAQIYTSYPVTLIVPADSAIQSVADLKGHSVGIPGEYGATYIGLLSLLHSAGLSKSDVNIQDIGFTQAAALLGHKVDAVMGYVNNEPVLLKQAGFSYRTFPVTQPLISNGLAAMQSELAAHGDDIRALVRATLRGVQYAIAHPQDAVNIAKSKYVATLNDPAQAAQALAVLQATLPLWQQPASGAGSIDAAHWQAMGTFLKSQGLLASDADVAKGFSNAYLPA
jgi:NitT/TauT family transport system substrate-binding protein